MTVSSEARRLQTFLFTAPVWWLRPVMWLVAGGAGALLPPRTAKEFGIYPCTWRDILSRFACQCWVGSRDSLLPHALPSHVCVCCRGMERTARFQYLCVMLLLGFYRMVYRALPHSFRFLSKVRATRDSTQAEGLPASCCRYLTIVCAGAFTSRPSTWKQSGASASSVPKVS